MKPFTLQEVVTALEGTLDRQVPLGSVTRVSIDSRHVEPGDLFFAIKGERFDGHDFTGEALAAGAMGAVVRGDFELSRPLSARRRAAEAVHDAVLIRVEDPVAAMGRLAQYCRRCALDGSATVVAVTGSNGKTTTKSMIAHVLSGRWQGRASVKSFNNAVGVPLTLLSTEPGDEFVICEVGTNAPGEIAALARLIEPDIAVVTGIAEAHLAGLGSLDRIADEKLSLLRHLTPGGCTVVNADHELLRRALERDHDLARLKSVTFGEWPEADLRVSDVRVSSEVADAPADEAEGGSEAAGKRLDLSVAFTVNDRFAYRLGVPGRHNVSNALAAIAVARRFGMDHDEIAARLATFRLPAMRLECERVGELTLINDAYNANPASLSAAVNVLTELPVARRRVLIVGDMRELGPATERLHREAAERIGRSGIDVVIAVGEHARLVAAAVRGASGELTETHAYGSTTLARRRLVSYLRRDDTILVKGSRVLALETLVKQVREWAVSGDGSRPAAGAASRRRGRVRV